MSAFLSTYLAPKYLDHLFNATAFAAPANTYLALFTTDPTAAGTGTEVTGGSYARQSISMATATSTGTITSDAAITFTALPTAAVTHYGIYDASTGGNLLLYGALPSSVIVNSGEQISFPTGNLDLNIAGS